MKKLYAALLLAIVAAGLLFYRGNLDGLIRRFENKNPDEIKLYGNVEIRQVLLGFRVPGRVEALYREEGERVESGDLLSVLDPVPYEIKKAEARAALLEAQATLNKLNTGFRSGEINEAAAKRDRVQAALVLADKDYARISSLVEQKALAKNDLDKVTAQRNALRAELSAAENALSLMRAGFRKEDIAAAEAAVGVGKARLSAAENALSDTKLYAPSTGAILTRVTEPGTVVGAGQVVYALALSRPVQVRAYVSEPQLGRVRMGMSAEIFTDSHPDPVEGKLVFISPTAEFTPKQVQTEELRTDLVYRVRILIENDPEERLKNGMPVTVRLQAPQEK